MGKYYVIRNAKSDISRCIFFDYQDAFPFLEQGGEYQVFDSMEDAVAYLLNVSSIVYVAAAGEESMGTYYAIHRRRRGISCRCMFVDDHQAALPFPLEEDFGDEYQIFDSMQDAAAYLAMPLSSSSAVTTAAAQEAKIDRQALSSDFFRELFYWMPKTFCYCPGSPVFWNKIGTILDDIQEGQIIPNDNYGTRTKFETILHRSLLSGVPPHVLRKLLTVVDLDFCLQPASNGYTPLHLSAYLIYKKCNFHFESLVLLASARPSLLMINVGGDGDSPLRLLLLTHGHDRSIAVWLQQLLDLCPDAIDVRYRDGRNLLHYAVQHSSTDSTRVLLERMDPSMLLEPDHRGDTPLHLVVRKSMSTVEHMNLCLEHVNAEELHTIQRATDGKNLLHLASERSRYLAKRDIVKLLVERDPHLCDTTDHNGDVPLDTFQNLEALPVASGERLTADVETALTLLARRPVRVTDRPAPSLHALLRDERPKLFLKTHFAVVLEDQLTEVDDRGDMPLHIVAAIPSQHRSYNRNHFQRLLQVVLDGDRDACRIRNDEGLLPLTLMVSSGHPWRDCTQLVFDCHPAAVGLLNLDDAIALLRSLGDDVESIYSVLHWMPTLML